VLEEDELETSTTPVQAVRFPEDDEGPPDELLYKRHVGFISSVRELWQARELVRTLTERELLARYKQAALGLAWAVITPLILMLVFSTFFHRVAKTGIDTHGVPYPLFSYVALLPWTFFSTSVNNGGQSLYTNSNLLNKVYCPREVFPIAMIATAGFDFIISSLILGVLFITTGYGPTSTAYWVPLLLAIQLAFTTGVTVLLSALVVYIRDLRQLIPLVLQLGLFATPVAWGIETIPEQYRTLYAVINPLGPVIDGYRRTVLYGQNPRWDFVIPGAIASVVWLCLGYLIMKRLETRFADVA